MHGLVPQPAIPSPHAEYLGITPSEVSNADRSSALGLRLNQQHKMKNNNNKIITKSSAIRGVSLVQSVRWARSDQQLTERQGWCCVSIAEPLPRFQPLLFPFPSHNCKDKSPPGLAVARTKAACDFILMCSTNRLLLETLCSSGCDAGAPRREGPGQDSASKGAKPDHRVPITAP